MRQQPADIELSAIKQMELLAAARPDTVSLAQGIPSFDTPKPIIEFVARAISEGRTAKYSLAPGLIELREAIGENLAGHNMYYDFEAEIIVTAGAIEALSATMLAVLQPGDEVLLPSPSYVSYRQSIMLAKALPVYVPLRETATDWQLGIEDVTQALSKRTKAILLCNPNNPTGTIYNEETLRALAALAETHDFFIILDEVYRDFLYSADAAARFFCLATLPEYRHRIIRIYSFSKIAAMTGWRIGYVHTAAPLCRKILAVHDSLVTCAPVVSQYAALAALRMSAAEWAPYIAEYRRRRDIALQALSAVATFMSCTSPEAAYFLFPTLHSEAIKNYQGSVALAQCLLTKAGVATVPGAAFGPGGEDHLRLSFGREEDAIVEGIRRMKDYFTRL